LNKLVLDVTFSYLNSKELNLGYAYISLIGRNIRFVFAPHDIDNTCRRKHSFTLTDPGAGEVICVDCGKVISDRPVESDPEWGTSTNIELVSSYRGGMPMSLAIHDQGLSTKIGRENRDFTGEMIVDSSMLSILKRIRTWDYRTQTRNSKGISRKVAFGQLDRLKQKLVLPDSVVEKTAYIYRKVQQKNITRGRTTTGALAACVYIACREAAIPRTFNEVAEVSNIRRKEMWDAYMAIVLELGLKIPLIDPVRCVLKLTNKTGVSEKIKRAGIDYMKQVMDSNASAGRDPMGLAATVLYIACQNYGDRSSQKYFAEAAGISDVTIRNRYQELRSKIPGLSAQVTTGENEEILNINTYKCDK
jgi:transcription initiation factor TFIIB